MAEILIQIIRKEGTSERCKLFYDDDVMAEDRYRYLKILAENYHQTDQPALFLKKVKKPPARG